MCVRHWGTLLIWKCLCFSSLGQILRLLNGQRFQVAIGTVRPKSAYVLLLHFTFASGTGVGHAGCAEFSFLQSFPSFPSAGAEQGQAGPVRVRVYVRESEIN